MRVVCSTVEDRMTTYRADVRVWNVQMRVGNVSSMRTAIHEDRTLPLHLYISTSLHLYISTSLYVSLSTSSFC